MLSPCPSSRCLCESRIPLSVNGSAFIVLSRRGRASVLRHNCRLLAPRSRFVRCLFRHRIECSLSLHNGVPRVIIRIVFSVRAVVGDSLDDFFWVVTSGEGALRIGPVMFGLAQRARLRRSWRLRMVARPEITLDRLGAEPEIVKMIDAVACASPLAPETRCRTSCSESPEDEARESSRWLPDRLRTFAP